MFFDSNNNLLSSTPAKKPLSKPLNKILKCSDTLFLDFLHKCLIWDANQRLTPNQALRHPWVTLQSSSAEKPFHKKSESTILKQNTLYS